MSVKEENLVASDNLDGKKNRRKNDETVRGPFRDFSRKLNSSCPLERGSPRIQREKVTKPLSLSTKASTIMWWVFGARLWDGTEAFETVFQNGRTFRRHLERWIEWGCGKAAESFANWNLFSWFIFSASILLDRGEWKVKVWRE